MFPCQKSYGQAGALDLTFNSTGTMLTMVGTSGEDIAYSVITQSDGKILVGGSSYNGSNHDFALVRYNINGSIDSTFDLDGRVTTPIGSMEDRGQSVVLQSDGKILLAGYAWIGPDFDFAMVRYNSDGSLDTTFDIDGKVVVAIGTTTDYGYSAAMQSDGKILITGVSHVGLTYYISVVRFNSNGSLDTSFDSDGKVMTTIPGSRSNSIALQSDGKIVVAGLYQGPSNYDVILARYNTDGTLDLTFDTDGIVMTQAATGDDAAQSVAIQSDGKIIVAGYGVTPTLTYNPDLLVVRYNSDGSLDTSFDGDGVLLHSLGYYSDVGMSIQLQSNGKIVVGGVSEGKFALVRLNDNGTFDTTLDSDGIVTTSLVSSNNTAYSACIQSDGKIILAGLTTFAFVAKFGVARYIGCAPDQADSINGLTSNCLTGGVTTYNIEPLSGATNYNWTLPSGWAGSSTTNSITVTPDSTGGTIIITASNSCGSSLPQTLEITVSSVPIINLGPDIIQCGGTVTLDAGIAVGSYLWSDASSAQTLVVSSSGNYSLFYTDVNGCEDTDTAMITINAIPNALFVLDPSFVCEGTVPFLITGGTPSGGTYTGTGVIANVFNPSVAGIGTHLLSYVYEGKNGCVDSAFQTITVDLCSDIQFVSFDNISVYPNPSNGIFTIKTNNTSVSQLEIYNVLGEKIYKSAVINAQIEIDLSKQSKGVYFVQMVDDKNTILTKKIIIQ